MTYSTKITSKGTITIAAPIRQALGLKTGQKLSMAIDKDNQIILNGGTDMKAFQRTRAKMTKNLPNHLKGISGEPLRQATAKAWIAGNDN